MPSDWTTSRCSARQADRPTRWRAAPRAALPGSNPAGYARRRRSQASEWPACSPSPIGRCSSAPRSETGSWRASRNRVAVGPRGAVWDMALLGQPWGFDLQAVDLPVALWHGERDRNVPVAHGRYLAGAVPGCRATFYAADAHLSTFVEPSARAHGRARRVTRRGSIQRLDAPHQARAYRNRQRVTDRACASRRCEGTAARSLAR